MPDQDLPTAVHLTTETSRCRRDWVAGKGPSWKSKCHPRHRPHRCARARTRPVLAFETICAWLLVASCVFRPTAAVFIRFENCLPTSYVYNTPTPLQWVPLYVDAKFDRDDPDHELVVTMWGNVTGSYNNVTLPPWNSSYWTDPTMTDGKIIENPEPDAPRPKLTTLHSKVDVLTYEPWNATYNFCNDSLVNATCPLGPVFNASALDVPYGLPSVNMANKFFSSYAFTSFTPTFLIIYGDQLATNIGCVSTTITPDLGNLAMLLKFLPLMVLLLVGFATVFAGIYSPWGTTDIFHWTSNYGRDADLLRLVTPGFGDCLQYIQFIVLTGGLTLNYPGFYPPITSQVSWSTLMFNESFVSNGPGYTSLRDGIYVTNGTYGLQEMAQLVGMGNVEDIWAGMMVWLLVIIGAVSLLAQAGFIGQWIRRLIKRIPEEDFRSKNIPFTLGNVVRIVLHYFLFPIVALSTFQLVVAGQSQAYTVALAVISLVIIIGFAGWLLYLIINVKPRAFLFDDLPTLLLYGPLYNTYSDEAASFAFVPFLCTFLRGIAVGAVQPSGVAQVVLLAICEVVQILTLFAFRPFHLSTSMNAYHVGFSVIRLISVLLMIAFVPSLGVTDGSKGWIGYAILVLHCVALILGFFLNALQTIVEVVARMLGAGGDDVRGQTRGGLSKIFGMRQLSRRMPRREGPSRQSQMSSAAMLDGDEASKSGYHMMQGGRVRSESAGSIGILLHNRQGSSSGFDTLSMDAGFRHVDSGLGPFTPTTPGQASVLSFLPSPGTQTRQPSSSLAMQAADPYYRPPRARRQTLENSPIATDKPRSSWTSGEASQKRGLQAAGADASEIERSPSGAAAYVPFVPAPISFTPRTDYSTRESDFYYGIRGERLNSDAPGRKLGTGPADPTGPMASAAGWLRTMLGGKSKEKGKGFEVVRSSRMPTAMRAPGLDVAKDGPPQGIPVAMGRLRNGPIESDDEDSVHRPRSKAASNKQPQETDLLDEDGNPQDDDTEDSDGVRVSDVPPVLPNFDTGGSITVPSRVQSKASRNTAQSTGDQPRVPELPPDLSSVTSDSEQLASPRGPPRLAMSGTTSSRLPFERSNSQRRLSGSSIGATTDGLSQIDLNEDSALEPRPTSYGFVHQGSVNQVDHVDVGLLGSSAEVVDERM